jgi:hypothetical protein
VKEEILSQLGLLLQKHTSVISDDEILYMYVRKTAYDNVWTFSGEASEKI